MKDHVVNEYGEALTKINKGIIEQQNSVQRVEFNSLHDIFFADKETRSRFHPDLVADVTINHPLQMPVAEEAEVDRKVLMASCHIENDALRSRISSQESSILALYRGFSRFMLEDLAAHERTIGLSKNKCKKLSSEVAFEMISVSFHTNWPQTAIMKMANLRANLVSTEKSSVLEYDRTTLSMSYPLVYTRVSHRLMTGRYISILTPIPDTRTMDLNLGYAFCRRIIAKLSSRLMDSGRQTRLTSCIYPPHGTILLAGFGMTTRYTL